MNANKLRLNFLPLFPQDFKYKVWRREYKGEKKEGLLSNLYRNTLPNVNDVNIRKDYWISFEPQNEFEEFICKPHYNHRLTQHYLFYLLKLKLIKSLATTEYKIPEKKFYKRVYLILSESNLGKETVWLEPYYLKVSKKFGLLIGFKFLKSPDVPYSREIQKLSLSLDKNYRSNRNFYLDKYKKIEEALSRFLEKIFPMKSNLEELINVSNSFEDLPYDSLNVKHYIFNKGNIDISQYRGLEKYGPLEPILQPLKIFLIYKDEENYLANSLEAALHGNLKYIRFPGLETMFQIKNIHIIRYPLASYKEDELLRFIDTLNSSKKGKYLVFPIMIIEKNTKNDDIYYFVKYELLKNGYPIQFVTTQLIRNKEAFKWSISNIALQIFAKLGGKPWKVRPSNENCIILGIGQAHQKIDNEIKKYFAYSVCTDSSGIYRKIGVLGDSDKENNYLNQLKDNIVELIQEFISEGFKSIVIHTPFRMERKELETIYNSIQMYYKENEQRFKHLDIIVLRINFKNKYFGFAYTNSMVPYESTFVRISKTPSIYLVWFEGLQYHRETITKRIPGPIFIEFYWTNRNLTQEDELRYLQDVLNLSGANWRGFNAKNLPVSIYYSQLIANFLKKFPHEVTNISEIKNPWFL